MENITASPSTVTPSEVLVVQGNTVNIILAQPSNFKDCVEPVKSPLVIVNVSVSVHVYMTCFIASSS